jgi:oligo-alginate lyase
VHGKFDPVIEFSTNSYPSVQQIRLLQDDENYTVAMVTVGGKKLLVAQSNKNFNKNVKHSTQGIDWTGPFTVLYNGATLR